MTTHKYIKENILITGAAKRIGAVLAKYLCQCGYGIAIHYNHSAKDAENLLIDLKHYHDHIITIQADMRDDNFANTIMTQAKAKNFTIDHVIFNANYFSYDVADNINQTILDDMIQINIKAQLILADYVVKNIHDNYRDNIDNHFCFILDTRVNHPNPDFYSYGISQYALYGAYKMLAQALAPSIRVNAIAPGITLAGIHQTEEDFTRHATHTPLQKATSPNDIAHAVKFLMNTSSITGDLITLDNGEHLNAIGRDIAFWH